MKRSKTLHIISLQVPYPPDYGGVIDIYHKIRHLNNSGWKVILHCFIYGREKSTELEALCEKVCYYPRKTGIFSQLHFQPYIVRSRRSADLLRNLLADEQPILFEGIHSCYYLSHPSLKNRNKIVRTHNIEHHYYRGLCEAEKRLWKKLFFLLESFKLRFAEKRFRHAQWIAAISEADHAYFSKRFGKTLYIPPFHSNDRLQSLSGRGDYMLFHGNMSVPENQRALRFLLLEICGSSPLPLKVAGKNIPAEIISEAREKNLRVEFYPSPGTTEMDNLIMNAQLILLFSFQSTGIKLKLMDSLFKGRYCIANGRILTEKVLENTCIRADTADEILAGITKIKSISFTDEDIQKRRAALRNYENEGNCARLTSAILNH